MIRDIARAALDALYEWCVPATALYVGPAFEWRQVFPSVTITPQRTIDDEVRRFLDGA